MLKEEIGDSALAEIHEYLPHAEDLYQLFPQVFPELKLKSIDGLISFDFIVFDCISVIYINYSIKLFVKYYKRLSLEFFADEKISLKELPAPTASAEELEKFADNLFTKDN